MVRVKGGISLRNGMWHGLRNDIIMRKNCAKKKFNRKACARLCRAFFWRQFERAIDLLVHLLLLLKQG